MNGTRLASYLASGQYTHNELASAMGIWCHVTDKSGTAIHDGLIARRILEIKLFLYGDYSGSSSPKLSLCEVCDGAGQGRGRHCVL